MSAGLTRGNKTAVDPLLQEPLVHSKGDVLRAGRCDVGVGSRELVALHKAAGAEDSKLVSAGSAVSGRSGAPWGVVDQPLDFSNLVLASKCLKSFIEKILGRA